MLSEFDQVETTYGADKAADLRKACRYLVRNQFAFAGDRGVGLVYNMLTDGRFRRTVDDFFDCLGYRVVREAEEQWVGLLLDDDDSSSVPRLRLDETMAVLVLACHWQEDADRGDLEDRAVAVTTLNVLHERYRDILQAGAKPTITGSRFSDILKDLALRNLVRLGEFDREQQDREVEIRPMIKLVSGDAPLRRIEDYLRHEEAVAPREEVRTGEVVEDGT